jgi:TfoX/Sxy family transcriptional regulator of competence genes
MAFNETLATRVRSYLVRVDGTSEKKMFGGIVFLVRGNMSVGVHSDELIVRIDPKETASALRQPGVRIFDLSGRPMKGWLLVEEIALKDKKSLGKWVDRGVNYAMTLSVKYAWPSHLSTSFKRALPGAASRLPHGLRINIHAPLQ